MKYAFLVFAATWLSVFTLGLQSLNVNQGHYFAAGVTSLFIGTGHIFLYRFMPGAGVLEFAGYFAGGVIGITSSMWFHRCVKAWLQRRTTRQPGPAQPMPRSPDEHTDVANCGGCAHHTDTH